MTDQLLQPDAINKLRAEILALRGRMRWLTRTVVVLALAVPAIVLLTAQDRRQPSVQTASKFVVQYSDGSTAAVLDSSGLKLSGDGQRTHTEIGVGRITLANNAGKPTVRLRANDGASLELKTGDADNVNRVLAGVSSDGRAGVRIVDNGVDVFRAGRYPSAGGLDPIKWHEGRTVARVIWRGVHRQRKAQNGRLRGLVVKDGDAFAARDKRGPLGLDASTFADLEWFAPADIRVQIISADEGRFRIVIRGSAPHSPGGVLTLDDNGREQLKE